MSTIAFLTIAMHGRINLDAVRALGRRLLDDPRFRATASTLQAAERRAGGYRRAADELELYLQATGRGRSSVERSGRS